MPSQKWIRRKIVLLHYCVVMVTFWHMCVDKLQGVYLTTTQTFTKLSFASLIFSTRSSPLSRSQYRNPRKEYWCYLVIAKSSIMVGCRKYRLKRGCVSWVSKLIFKMCCNPSKVDWHWSTELGFAQKPQENQAELRLLKSEWRILPAVNFYPSEIKRTVATVCQLKLWSCRFGYSYFQETGLGN